MFPPQAQSGAATVRSQVVEEAPVVVGAAQDAADVAAAGVGGQHLVLAVPLLHDVHAVVDAPHFPRLHQGVVLSGVRGADPQAAHAIVEEFALAV